jgi:hypothetical protein
MVTFIEFLEELERNHQTVLIPKDELDRLTERFGSPVLQMGSWNKTTDGSLEIPMSNIAEAARNLDNKLLGEALKQLKTPEELAEVLNSSSGAVQLIEALSRIYLERFESRVARYQDTNDPTEADRLRREISRELFGQ